LSGTKIGESGCSRVALKVPELCLPSAKRGSSSIGPATTPKGERNLAIGENSEIVVEEENGVGNTKTFFKSLSGSPPNQERNF